MVSKFELWKQLTEPIEKGCFNCVHSEMDSDPNSILSKTFSHIGCVKSGMGTCVNPMIHAHSPKSPLSLKKWEYKK